MNKMHNVIEENSVIKVKSLCSEDGEYRYTLTKTWDENGLKATVIGINPSRATQLKGDNTATNTMNFLIDNGYGEMTIVNLFPYRCVNSEDLNKRKPYYDNDNMNYIKAACDYADMILVIWGYDKAKYLSQKKKVEKLLLQHKEKVRCFRDVDGKKPQHLRILSDKWDFVSYF